MTGLVAQLQADALDDKVPVTTLLRKAKTVAAKLKLTDIEQWLKNEMTGYNDQQSVPSYRQLPASIKFKNPMRGICPVINSEHIFSIGTPISAVEELLASDGEAFYTPAPPDIAQKVCEDAGFNMEVLRQISRNAVASVLSAVRDEILDWSLKLEAAGISGEGLSFTSNEATKAQNVTFNIGSIGNASGLGAFGDNATVTTNQKISIKQLTEEVVGLVHQIKNSIGTSTLSDGLKAEVLKEVDALEVEATAKKPDQGKLKKGLVSLQHVLEGAAGDLMATGAGALIAHILAHYHLV